MSQHAPSLIQLLSLHGVCWCRFPAKMRAGHGKAVLRWIGQHAQHATSLRLFGQGDKGTSLPFCGFLLPGLRHLHIEVNLLLWV
jgi:hypothetical protein